MDTESADFYVVGTGRQDQDVEHLGTAIMFNDQIVAHVYGHRMIQ